MYSHGSVWVFDFNNSERAVHWNSSNLHNEAKHFMRLGLNEELGVPIKYDFFSEKGIRCDLLRNDVEE